ncbi:MAG TPA: DsbA family protein [Candidatus Dormibacteraeota bacterium]|nr:DsbA family protein [Candidatus Dormibacteraeota bacterium]
MSIPEPTTTVFLHVDPACPWAWLTSRWMVEVARVRPVRVATRLFDLAEINRERDQSDQRMQRSHSAGEHALRVLVLVEREHGNDAMARAYTEIGEAWHERGEPLGELPTLRGALEAAGLDPSLADRALADDSTYDDLLAQHREACEQQCFGVPTLSFDGSPAIFGPVVDRRLSPEEAGELWDHTAWLIRHGFFFELKRNRTTRADVGRYRIQTAA